jgi:hypothetical protein
MFPPEADVTLSVSDELRDRSALTGGGPIDRLGHSSDIGPALLVFVEHHARRAALARKPLGLHRREEVRFFLTMVAAVGEVAEEVQRLLRRGLVQSPLGRTILGHLFQAIEYLFDDAVFATKDFGGLHGPGSLRNARQFVLLNPTWRAAGGP